MADDERASAHTESFLGECLVDLAPEEPVRWSERDDLDRDDDRTIAELARAAPYVTRIRHIAHRLDDVDVMSFRDTLWCARDGAPIRHLRGGGDLAGFLGYMVLIAAEQRLLHIVEDGPPDGLIAAGAERQLADVHPAATWGEAVTPALLGDSEGGVLETVHRGPLAEALSHVPWLLYQLLVSAGYVDLRVVRDALHLEALRKQLFDRPPARRQLELHLATTRALFLELGLAEWEPEPGGRLGRLTPTGLGLFGYIIFDSEDSTARHQASRSGSRTAATSRATGVT